ncbi:hypothetical protein AB0C86_36640 [Streptomyces lavendulae]
MEQQPVGLIFPKVLADVMDERNGVGAQNCGDLAPRAYCHRISD